MTTSKRAAMEVTGDLVTDVLVIGGGAAGSRAALASIEAGARVTLVNKGQIGRSGITITAGGGMEAPFHPDDTEELFVQDVVQHGYLLGDQNLIQVLVQDAKQRIYDCERFGVRFRKNPDGSFVQTQMPGQTVARNVRLAQEGYGLSVGLGKAARRAGVTVLEDFAATELAQTPSGQVVGALGMDLQSGAMVRIQAGSVIIATGGCEAMWKVTDCPADSTGDGLVLAYNAGARLVDLEMMLFYPSVVIWPPAGAGSFMHYEWLEHWAADGEIRNAHGESVLPKPLPVRDISMRLMWKAIEEGQGAPHGGLWWDVSRSPKGYEVVNKFLQGQQYRYFRTHLGIDPSRQPVEVAPGAHYQLGGIYINERCETGVPGLFAVPEAAGNFEGANRLSGTALAGTQVFGAIAGREAAAFALSVGARSEQPGPFTTPGMAQRFLEKKSKPMEMAGLRVRLQEIVWRRLGLRRDVDSLEALGDEVEELCQELARVQVAPAGRFNQALLEALELEHMVTLSRLIAGSAKLREESRGHHFRSDFPERDDLRWLRHTCVQRANNTDQYGSIRVDHSLIPPDRAKMSRPTLGHPPGEAGE